jgi:hypothetical protein
MASEVTPRSYATQLTQCLPTRFTVVHQTRDIAYDLRPPVLDDHGLVAAILDRTAGEDGPVVRVTAPDPLVLPATVDLAALRIVTETVANARKHGEAKQVSVDLAVHGDRLELSVADDAAAACPPTCNPESACTPSLSEPPSSEVRHGTTDPHPAADSPSRCHWTSSGEPHRRRRRPSGLPQGTDRAAPR